jgi:outer membrane receptor protein involved in Fe transport
VGPKPIELTMPPRRLPLIACLLALAGASAAQEAAPPAAEAAAPAAPPAADIGIEEIIVTITKRDESLQEVPASISAFSPETLELANIESASDLVTLIPNVVTKGESRTGNFSIRGVSESFSSQSPVAYHVNGIFKFDIDSLLGQYYDLESIQLVRGPSGTVYGRNATAGAIDLRWAKPHPGFELTGDALYGNYDHIQVRGLLNTPLLGADDERLMARLVLQFDDRDGYMDDLTDRSRDDDPHNAEEFYSRLSLRSLPSEDVELNLRAFYNQSDADPYVSRPLVDEYTQGFLDTRQFDAAGNLIAENFNVVDFDPYQGYTGFVDSLVDNLITSNDPNIQQLEGLIRLGARVSGVPFRTYATDVMINGIPDLVPPIVDQFLEPPAQLGLTALPIPSDPLQVRSSAYLRHQTKLRVYGADGSLAWDFSAGALGDLRLDFLFGYEHVHFDQVVDADGSELPIIDVFRPHRNNHYTGELRLSSQGDGAVDWIAGLFYFQHRTDRAFDEITLPFGPIISELHGVSRGFAPFVSASLRPLELLGGAPKLDLELFGGWRWNRDEYELDYENLASPAGPSGLKHGDETFTEDTWEVGIRWRPSENHMLYAKFAKGYKAGILEADNQTAEISGVDPELIRAWEVGLRSTLWDGRAQLGLTGFWSSYTDLQVPQTVGLSQRTLNAAEATIRGVEVEALVHPVEGLVLQASAGYLDAVFDEFCSDDAAQMTPSDPGCPAANPNFPWQGQQNLAGERLEDAPRWKTSWFARYAIDLGDHGTLTPVVKLTWTDDYKLRPYGLPADWVQSYTRTDVRLLWNSLDDRFSVEAFCENLEDEVVYARNATTGEFSGSFPASLGLIPPRTYGLRIGYHWTAGGS